jgi:hypothetical protein
MLATATVMVVGICAALAAADRADDWDVRPAVPVPASLRDFRAVAEAGVAPAPVRVRIPAIGVNAPLERLRMASGRTVAPPRRWGRAGWFTGGPRPGEPGAAVVLGHYDSPWGKAVFYRLSRLRPGQRVVVERRDGSRVTFRVQRIGQFRTDRFPVRQVYWPTLRPELRLITCSGPYLHDRGRYRDNTVVFAVQTPDRTPSRD